MGNINLEYKFLKTAIISFNTNYYTGFKKVSQLNINYKLNNFPQLKGYAISKGEFWSFGFGLKYPISNFWKKKS